MKVRVFTLRFDPARGGFDDDALREWMDSVEVVETETFFFEHERAPWMSLVVSYRPIDEAPSAASGARPAWAERREGLQRELDPAERARFEALRAWRGARARADGLPVYLVLTNRQLAAIAKARPTTLEALGRIDGVGDGKVRSFAEDVLRVLAETDPAPPAGSP